jgi:hypothetical protein
MAEASQHCPDDRMRLKAISPSGRGAEYRDFKEEIHRVCILGEMPWLAEGHDQRIRMIIGGYMPVQAKHVTLLAMSLYRRPNRWKSALLL